MNLVGFDTETERFGPGLKAPRLVCYSTSDPTIPLSRWDEKEKLFRLWQRAADGEISLIGHIVAYDAAVLCAQYPDIIPIVFEAYAVGSIHDIGLREMLLQLEMTGIPYSVSLDTLSQKYTNNKLDKEDDGWRLRYSELRDTPLVDWPERAKHYAITDATVLIPIWHAQEKRKRHHDTFHNQPARARIAFAIQLMTAWGLKTDPPMVEKMIDTFQRAQVEQEDLLKSAGLMRANGSFDTKAVVKMVEELSGEPLPRTKKGKPSLKKDHLSTLGIPLVDKYIQYKEDGKMVNTYLSKYRSGLVQCSTNPLLTNGRISLSKPSLQNLPSRGENARIREIFIPRPGKVLCSTDYAGVELRTFAEHCLNVLGISKLAEIYQADPHADVPTIEGAALAGLSVDDAIARRKAGDPSFKPFRRGAKAALYGFHGGMGPKTFIASQKAQGVNFTLEQAEKLKREHFEWLPELNPFFQHIKHDHVWRHAYTKDGKPTKKTDYQTTKSRRHRGNVGWCQVSNGKFSDPMADGAGDAMFNLVKAMYAEPLSILYGTRLICYIHDESLTELDEHKAHEQALEVSRIMCDAMREHTPNIPIVAEPCLMTGWYKEAEPVYDAGGKLIVWK